MSLLCSSQNFYLLPLFLIWKLTLAIIFIYTIKTRQIINLFDEKLFSSSSYELKLLFSCSLTLLPTLVKYIKYHNFRWSKDLQLRFGLQTTSLQCILHHSHSKETTKHAFISIFKKVHHNQRRSSDDLQTLDANSRS